MEDQKKGHVFQYLNGGFQFWGVELLHQKLEDNLTIETTK